MIKIIYSYLNFRKKKDGTNKELVIFLLYSILLLMSLVARLLSFTILSTLADKNRSGR